MFPAPNLKMKPYKMFIGTRAIMSPEKNIKTIKNKGGIFVIKKIKLFFIFKNKK